jgi:hypothetical protein
VDIDLPLDEATRKAPVDVSLTVAGGFDPSMVRELKVRKGGASTYQTSVLQKEEGLSSGTPGEVKLTGTIDASLVTSRGIDYRVILSDGSDTLTVPAGVEVGAVSGRKAHLPVSFEVLSPPDTAVTFAEEEYRLVSVPALPTAGTKAALRSSYGSYDQAEWRLLQWDAGERRYREFPEINALASGEGFWLVVEQGTPPVVSGGTTVQAEAAERIPIEAGWNQVGNPFGFEVSWDTVRTASGLSRGEVDGPFTYRNGEFQPGETALRPWEGYFVFASTADTLVVPPVGANATEGASSSATTFADVLRTTEKGRGGKTRAVDQDGPAVRNGNGEDRYTLTVQAAGKTGRGTVKLGLWPEAKAGRDAFDLAQPPSVRDRVRISSVETVEDRSVPHAGSAKPPETRGGGTGQSWRLRVSAPDDEGRDVKLFLGETGAVPEGGEVYLLDLARKQRLARGATLSLNAGETRPLKAIIGTRDYAKTESDIDLSSLETTLRAPYPNPFDREATIEYVLSTPQKVTIEIYDVLGRRIRTLVDEQQAAGVHTLTWNGESRYGTAVGSGMYFCRMRAGDATATKKIVRVR